MVQKRWNLLPAADEKVNVLYDCLKVHPVLCKILVQRGLENFELAKTYFRPELNQLHDPWLMKDMRKAVDRITTAISNGEKILVFGDYDVDGTTAVACMYRFLQKFCSPDQLDFYI